MRSLFVRNLGAAACAASLLLAGCDKATRPEAQIPQQDAQELLMALSQVVMGGGSGSSTRATPSTPAFAHGPSAPLWLSAAAADEVIDETFACPKGGEMQMRGTTSDNLDGNGTGSVAFTMKLTPNRCGVATYSSGKTYVLSGDPDLSWNLNFSARDWSPVEVTYKYEGAFRWSTGASGGSTCRVSIQGKFDYRTGSGTGTAKVCGHDVTYSPTM